MIIVSCNNNNIINTASIQFDNNFLMSGFPRTGINNLGVSFEIDDSLEPKPAAIITNFN